MIEIEAALSSIKSNIPYIAGHAEFSAIVKASIKDLMDYVSSLETFDTRDEHDDEDTPSIPSYMKARTHAAV